MEIWCVAGILGHRRFSLLQSPSAVTSSAAGRGAEETVGNACGFLSRCSSIGAARGGQAARLTPTANSIVPSAVAPEMCKGIG